MTIRGRVTLWYSVVLLVSLLLAGGGTYYELVYERNAAIEKKLTQEPIEEEVGEIFLYFILPAMIVTVVGGWIFLRRSLAPLDQLAIAAERINAQNLHEPLPRSGNGDEVDRLSQVLNAMNQRIADAMKEIHEFTLHASHELKTPLTILHSEVETALSNPATAEPQRELLSSQLDEIQRLTRIVEGLTQLARTNAGQMLFAREPVAIHELIRETADDAIVLAHAKNINVQYDIQEPAIVIGDRHRLRQALLNLTENAVKYNRPGGAISMTSRHTRGEVIFEIANTGVGIGANEAPHIFKKFFRGSASRESNGIGLGLSIAQSIIQAHQGEISVQSAKPDWTTFRISLPRAHPDAGIL